jgi:WD40 repeat protein
MEALAWSPDGKYIASVGAGGIGEAGIIYVWDVETGEVITVFDEHQALVPSLAWSPDGSQIASGSWDRTVKIWDPLTGEVSRGFSLPQENYSIEVDSVDWSPDGDAVAALMGAEGVYVWNIQTGENTLSVSTRGLPPPNPIIVDWSPDSDLIATGVGVIEAETGAESEFEVCPKSWTVAWHPSSQYLALFVRDGVLICDVTADEVVAELEGNMDYEAMQAALGYLYSLDWHPDGERLAGAAGDGLIRIWQISDL